MTTNLPATNYITRRDLLRVCGGAAALVAAGQTPERAMAQPPAEAKEKRRVNVLFLMDDQHRGDCIGAAGASWLRTPNLDRLAREGALFRRAYTSLPSCLPARASLLTGKSPWAHGLLCYHPIPERYKHEKPRMFRDAGYQTHAIGKMHFDGNHGYHAIEREEAWRDAPALRAQARKQGKEAIKCDYRQWFRQHHPDKDVDATGLGYTDHRGGRHFPYDDALHPTNWTAQRAIDFLETYKDAKPWLLKVSFKRPHPPFDPPKRLLDSYAGVDFPMPQVGAWAEKEFGAMASSLEKHPNAPRGNVPEAEIRASRQTYYASITHVDEQVGRVLEALEKRGELENTLILFTADHGDMMGDQHLWRKTYAYEGSARVPMLVRWPERLASTARARRGQVLDQPVELRDVLPTFLDAAGIEQPAEMDGSSLLRLIRGEVAGWRKRLDLEHGTCYWRENSWVALTDRRYKYIYFTLTGKQQLFDLKTDPHELRDLAASPEHAALLRTWRAHMIQHLSVRGEPWVRDGDLAIQKKAIPIGPNDPRYDATQS